MGLGKKNWRNEERLRYSVGTSDCIYGSVLLHNNGYSKVVPRQKHAVSIRKMCREAAVTGVHRITRGDTTAWKVFIIHWPCWLYEHFSHREMNRNYQNYLVVFSICISCGQTCSVTCPQTFNHPVPRPPHSKSWSTHNSMLNL